MQKAKKQKLDGKQLETQHSVSVNNRSLGGSSKVSESNGTTVMDN
jgi:hypothetical protein